MALHWQSGEVPVGYAMARFRAQELGRRPQKRTESLVSNEHDARDRNNTEEDLFDTCRTMFSCPSSGVVRLVAVVCDVGCGKQLVASSVGWE